MDGNNAKKAPVLDHLVGTTNAPLGNKPTSSTKQQTQAKAKPVLASMKGDNPPTGATKNSAFRDPSGKPIPSAIIQPENQNQQNENPQDGNQPQNRRTDKSEFEIELARTVNKIMLKHFEHASEQIVQQVLSEVRARLPGRRK
ncbi:MAG: hypothetical protein HKN83_13495 [Gammaproteobacteria bacterium]|nr:hypothetical protein [Gammaproteobacteria bacterium]